MQPLPFYVYRHYDASDRLLYVGMSLSAATRLHTHMKQSPWAADIATVKVARFDTKEEAQHAEMEAIILEQPLWNDQFNRGSHNRHRNAARRILEARTCQQPLNFA